MNKQIVSLLLVIGGACILLGLYSSFGSKVEPSSPSAKRVPPPQPKVTSRDLRGKYGIVNHSIFNETTHVVFTTPQEFFNETGLNSFGGPIDHFDKLPRDCVFVDGTPLTERDYNMVELNR
jgi:hypothetical protein